MMKGMKPLKQLKLSVPAQEAPITSFLTASGTFHDGDLLLNLNGLRLKSEEKESTLPETKEIDLKFSLEDLETIKVIGKGSGGVVQLVRHKWVGTLFALKVIQMNIQEEIRKQIVQELKINQASQCPHVVVCYHSFYHNGAISLVFEYMDRGSLADVTKQVKTILEPYLAVVCKQVLQGLVYLHNERHVIHRDIKPSNLLVNQKGDVKITDFGVSAMLATSMGQRDTFVGTYNYMSPERISGGAYDYKSDIWSLGLVILECAIGRFPYIQSEDQQVWPSFYELLEAIVAKPPPSAPSDQFSPEFCSFVSSCIQKDPKDRSSALDLLSHPFIKKFEDKDIDLAILVGCLEPPINFTRCFWHMLLKIDQQGTSSMADETASMSIYRASRTIKRKQTSLYNSLRSIHEDSIFVSEIAQLWPELPLVANLRCGLWYAKKFYSNCYFKSTDGHTNNLSFNTSRLNLHVATLAGQKGGCMIVDSTRKGKRFPDSMSKTIPIWTCVLNRAILNHRNKMKGVSKPMDGVHSSALMFDTTIQESPNWDTSLHLPLWVPDTEKTRIDSKLNEWVNILETSGVDIVSISSLLKKPLRPLWISQKTVIWLNEVPDYNSWDFTPIILISASASSDIYRQKTSSEFSWNYIPGAGDDEESWARGLTPLLFWNNVYDLINSGPDVCNQMVANIVEKDRVFRAQRGQNAPQVSFKPTKLGSIHSTQFQEQPLDISMKNGFSGDLLNDEHGVFWLGLTNLAVCSTGYDLKASNVDSILNCDKNQILCTLKDSEAYLHLPIMDSKFDRFSLQRNLPFALSFAKLHLKRGKRLAVCCSSGEDISVCVCLAILISLFNVEGVYDDGKFFMEKRITKLDMRQRLIFVCKYVINARPSRGNLKQVYNFLVKDFDPVVKDDDK
ncbi:hypothetical protein QVD17_27715 [Tagetes erecta]|uniref:mitogen-activated protein kinase kinase n=1 Tax=Tagetes erecta TaxID=13708 RepID=A0AAD8KFD3_TARER|nr:hypothetical protein QVD17_27715 [Tagetes erecta]